MITKWEYKMEYLSHYPAPEMERIIQLGIEGWELASIAKNTETRGYYIFKRPINTSIKDNDTDNKIQG